ncbi:MAG: hypothetical protein ABL967_01670 [Bryobacteraceae bacterium]
MEHNSQNTHAWIPETDAERSAIREQLERILGSPLFKNSKRYPNLLRFVVERALQGHTEPLKERTLGIEVFGREPDYDTNLDPVVRTTAVEIRKRIAQYYHEVGHETEIRIDFPPGTYMPEFRMPTKPAVVAPVPEPPKPAEQVKKPALWVVAAIITSVGVAVAIVWLFPWMRSSQSTSELDRFWAPVLATSGPVTIYIGQNVPTTPSNTMMELQQAEQVAFADATAMARFTGFLTANHRDFRFRLQPTSRMEDLRDGPTILIGAFNNSWAIRLTEQLRFGFRTNPETHISGIIDRREQGALKWSQKMAAPYNEIKEDYALVSRVVDPTTGKIVVTASGITKFGTEAAGEFLTCESCMRDLASKAGNGWDRKNLEVVIGASVIGRAAGPPHVVAFNAN